MSRQLIIRGGKPLSGVVRLQGSKNASFPLIAACLLTPEPCRLENIPAISDISIMVEILRGLGAEASYDPAAGTLEISARELTSTSPNPTLVRKLRGSILIAGALLGRARRVAMPYPGGDAIGARPLGIHFHAFEKLGATLVPGDTVTIDGANLHGADFTLEEPSVTATENALLAAVLAPGKTIIRLPAIEPHVQELVRFLAAMGAAIRWSDLYRLEVTGVEKLAGAAQRLNVDELEVSSFATLAAATRSEITLAGIEPMYTEALLLQLGVMGVQFRLTGSDLEIAKPAREYKNFRVQSGLYPKLGSDHLPPFSVLATQAHGQSMIHDWLYEDRLRYITELQKMGANATILDPHRAVITGPSRLYGANIESADIRAGMTMVIAALVAEGESRISGTEHLERGYERLEERLQTIGADIRQEMLESSI